MPENGGGKWWVCTDPNCNFTQEYEGEDSMQCEGTQCPTQMAGADPPDCILKGGEEEEQ